MAPNSNAIHKALPGISDPSEKSLEMICISIVPQLPYLSRWQYTKTPFLRE